MVGDFGTTSDFQTQKKPPTLATIDFQSTQRLSESLATIDYQNFPGASDYEKDVEKFRFRNTQT